MSTETLNALKLQIDKLSIDEQLRLLSYLSRKAQQKRPSAMRRQWKEIRGVARPSLLQEDAQQWVTRNRQAADESRKSQMS